MRKRGINGNYIYFKTYKKKITDIKRVEIEKRLTEEEYLELLNNATDKYQVIKDRYCLIYDNQYFEIDVYPFWKDKACIELELDNEEQSINFPPFIEVIEEVTGNKNYSNSQLAVKINS